MTHYVPYFTVERSVFRGRVARELRAACGEYVQQSRHSAEPTCPECRAYLLAEATSDAETAAGFNLELRDGPRS